ncbi:FMN-linked oxidoreductase [Aspergillus crustosus]
MTETRLYQPLRIGTIQIQHRIAMAPMTRRRATPNRVPTPLMKEYYTQRAAIPRTLLITEGALISAAGAGGFANAPETITNAVHQQGSFIFVQLFAMGRAADLDVAAAEGVEIMGPSAIPIPHEEKRGAPWPREMSVAEIKQTVGDFGVAAKNAVAAGFNGVEDTSNQRTDKYGGCVENRTRLAYKVLLEVVQAIGPERVRMRHVDLIKKAGRLNLAYLHLVESRIYGPGDYQGAVSGTAETLDSAIERWNGPILVAGGYRVESAQGLVDERYPDKDVVVMFRRNFVSNPNFVYRVRKGVELTRYNRETFYSNTSAMGYVDYPFSEEYLATVSA